MDDKKTKEVSVSKDKDIYHKLPLTATGDLTVSKTPIPKGEAVNAKTGLPSVGTRFMIAGKSFEVVYLNEGKGRFTAKPIKGQY